MVGKVPVPGLRVVGFLAPEVYFLEEVVDPLFEADALLARPVDFVLLRVLAMIKN